MTKTQTDGIQLGQPEDDPDDAQLIKVGITEAIDICLNALVKAGYSKAQSAVITDHLVDAELRGHPFAGLARALSIIEFLTTTGMTTDHEIEVTRVGPTYAHLDGHDSVGYLVGYQATKLAIEKAKSAGVSVVGANGLWYTGNLAYYAEMATREDLVILIASNGCPIVAPYGGCEPKFCTNPFCIGFPTTQVDEPFIWDIGTSNIMYAQVKLAERLKTSIPDGSAFDGDGNPTTDPMAALTGALTAWGGPKGSGLAMMIQLLGIAAGSTEPTPFLSDFGFLIIAFDPSVLQALDRVKHDAEKFANSIRSTKMLPGQAPARMPFERSSESRRRAKARGYLEVPMKVIEELRSLGI
jgi:delta1-piperideine-2-carboxylate reductase